MLECQTISIAIDHPWEQVYESIWQPETFPTWAPGLASAPLVRDGDRWNTRGPSGPIAIRFTPHNPYGVMDHWVETSSGTVVYVPLRVVCNGHGAEVQLTLFRQPGMSTRQFDEDADVVQQDLNRLRAMFVPMR